MRQMLMLMVLALWGISPAFAQGRSQVYIESVFLEVSQSNLRDVGVGVGGSLSLFDLSFGRLAADLVLRTYFPEADNVSAIGFQAGPTVVLNPVVDASGIAIRPVLAGGFDYDRQRIEVINTNMDVTTSESGAFVLGGLRSEGRRFGAELGVLRTLFRNANTTEVRGRLIVFITPRLVQPD